MKQHSLLRWFRNISIANKLYLAVGVMALLIAMELFTLWFSINTLSSVRAYVGAEGLWSKSQKDAIYYLRKYVRSGKESDYKDYLYFLKVPLGDRVARIEMAKENPDYNIMRRGFLEGRIHPDDVDGMIKLFRQFYSISYINKAIRIWTEGDSILAQLQKAVDEIHSVILRTGVSTPETLQQNLEQIDEFNKKLTELEDDFSATLGQGSRWLENLILKILLSIALTVEISGLLLTISISRNISKGINEIVKVSEEVSKGNFRNKAVVHSKDEIGRLATSFNKMSDDLEENIKEREKAETDLENRVEERTKELQSLNLYLKQEVEKRTIAEEQVKQLNWAVSKTNNAIIIADKTGKIEWVNEGFQKLTEYNLEEVKDNFAARLNPDKPTGLNPASVHYQELMKTKKPVSYEMENYSKSGREYWAFTTLSPILDSNGNVEKIIAIDSDISKVKEVEQELIKAKDLSEQSAIMKEQFMANMSHEIRTPMNAIIGFANVLGKTKLDENQIKHLKAIQASGENLLTIINDILDFSKIESGMMNIEKTPFNPTDLLHSVKNMFLPRANNKKIQLDFFISDKLPETIIGDPTRLNQILVNLIGNALKFTSEGSISVKAELENEENGIVNIRFIIKDSGIGIPKEKLNQIFERFTQANADTNRKYGGSGLGLSIVKNLIELQGGTISVESAQGIGSSFTFIIPYKKSSATIRPEPVQPTQPILKTKIKILVAEDNVLNQQLAESLLSQWGFDFDIVENGKLAIEKLTSPSGANAYDLILMDIQMPEMNGYLASKFIREKLRLTLPIIAMTAHVLQGEKEKCLGYGMTDYISKPIHESELYNLIAKHIGMSAENENQSTEVETISENKNQVINLDYVKKLSNGNPQFVTKMIHLFLSEIPKEIQRLESAIDKKDMAAIHAIAHKINSTVAFVGLDKVIGNQISSIEKLAEDKIHFTEIEKLFSEVKDTCMKATNELDTLNIKYA